jgi:pimeloyl-ACP methyl ester carboxylesterase
VQTHLRSVAVLRGLILLVVMIAVFTACSTTPVRSKLPQLSEAKPAMLAGTCEELMPKLSVLPNTKITSVKTVPAGEIKVGGNAVAEHCLVTGSMYDRNGEPEGTPYAVGFEMRLPKNWNGRFWYQGNGGIDGAVQPALGNLGGGPVTNALLQGFAVISSDAGHDNRKTRGPGFGLDPQARLDYGYQAVGKLTPTAKKIIRIAYGKAPDRSYIGGCSNGGRHALVAAARYPEMFDGFLAGSPGFNLPKAAVANIFGAQQYKKVATDPKDLSTAFTKAERQTVVNAVLAKCDALDGARDGMIQDTDACEAKFNFMRDVPTCTGERNGTCLTEAQKQAIAPIFSGATTSDGKPFYASFPVDAGLAGPGIANWEFVAPIKLDSGAVGLIFGVPPQNLKGFDGPNFTLNGNIDAMLASVYAKNGTFKESAVEFMTPPNATDLSRVKARGGKILVYQGVSDPIFSVNDTKAWYESVQKANGGDASDFVRFFRIPGMDHCRDGAATDQFDAISALVLWVEQGNAPDRIIARARGAGNPGGRNEDLPADWSADRTRPLCPYPGVATYRGSGSIEDAGSFMCK